MMLAIFAYLFLAVSLLAAYWVMVRPLLRRRPAFGDLRKATGFSSAIWMKIDSIKTKLLAVSLMIASGLVAAHDFLIPLATGLDWTPVTSHVPPIAWPFVTIGFNALFFWLRKQTEDSAALKLVAVETGVVTATEAIKGDAAAEIAVKEMPAPSVAKAETAVKE